MDSNEALENNRAAMWQETRMNLQTGAFGDPTQTDTLILFWGKMEELHYPGAGTTKKYLEEKREREQAAATAAAATPPPSTPPEGGLDLLGSAAPGNMGAPETGTSDIAL